MPYDLKAHMKELEEYFEPQGHILLSVTAPTRLVDRNSGWRPHNEEAKYRQRAIDQQSKDQQFLETLIKPTAPKCWAQARLGTNRGIIVSTTQSRETSRISSSLLKSTTRIGM